MNRILIAMVTLACACSQAWAMGEEQFGNEPVGAANYAQAGEGILTVLNDPHRVYRQWVNGNEFFFFRGDTIALNAALKNFSEVASETLEVVLRPAPGVTSNLYGDQSIPYNWNLHLVGGIAAHMSQRDLGDKVWAKHPMMHVYVGGPIQLSELEIPKNLRVVQVSDLQSRYAEAFASSDLSVRGWTCGNLAALDTYDTDSMHRIAKMLDDEDNWVRINAAGALAGFGRAAEAVRDKLEAAKESGDESLKKRITETLNKTAAAEPNESVKVAHQKMLKAIAEFCAAR